MPPLSPDSTNCSSGAPVESVELPWGVTPQDFALGWVDGQGAAGFTGLTLHAAEASRPTASLTLSGYSQADLSNGRLSVSFGTDSASGSAYMYVHANS
jgi:hypothetical protein